MGEIRYTGQSRNYIAPEFQTSERYNQTYNYWIIFLNNTGFTSATVTINGNVINLDSSNINNAHLINSSWLKTNTSNNNQFLNNTVTLNATGGFGSSMNFFIVQAPKNINSDGINYDTVNPKNVYLYYIYGQSDYMDDKGFIFTADAVLGLIIFFTYCFHCNLCNAPHIRGTGSSTPRSSGR